ncbi:MAG: NAD(P)/FAD-dependent oxidoreductase [Granulosicoccus sp.]|nr:NAD(P)/FAD-dependent oxidoreductase [Granulosicoccus sp.]
MLSPDFECVVIGAGVVGLAIAASLAQCGRDVLLIERESEIGTATSARNSEVIHAGIYYRPGSLKARLCVQGKHALYRYCRDRAINYRRCGKLIVASSTAQHRQLAAIKKNARANGVDDLEELDADRARAMEPQLRGTAALYSPSTGIIDSHALMLSLLGDAENHGAMLLPCAHVDAVAQIAKTQVFSITVTQDECTQQLTCRYLINAAGHGACAIANTIEGIPESQKPRPVYYKGNYFRLLGPSPFSRLVYPVPQEGGLGVHITFDLAGQARFGPDVEPVEQVSYQVDPHRSDAFYEAIRQYWPALADCTLEPDYAGIRPRIIYQGRLHEDFLIQDSSEHSLAGLINLFSIESPGLTACLSIAEEVSNRLSAERA